VAEDGKGSPVRDYAKLFGAVIPLLEAFESLIPPTSRSNVAGHLSSDALGILRTFAHAMSLLAVRRNSPALIAQGLTALAILGSVDDIRDLTFYLATLYHSAIKREFPLRLPADRDLRAFGLREAITNEGFDLVQDNSRLQ
jgi:hypothetical protein